MRPFVPDTCRQHLRVVLLLGLILARGGTYFVEQPSTSMFRWYPRFDTFLASNSETLMHACVGFWSSANCHATQAWVIKWWMGMYGGLSPKRQVGYSNNPFAESINLGRFRQVDMRSLRQKNNQFKPTKTYRSKKDGRKCFCGTKQLKETQSLG